MQIYFRIEAAVPAGDVDIQPGPARQVEPSMEVTLLQPEPSAQPTADSQDTRLD